MLGHTRIRWLVLLLLACDGNGRAIVPPPRDGGGQEATLQRVAEGLSFPVHVTSPPGDPRLFIVEKGGRIKVLAGGRVQAEPFLDLSGQVSGGSEQGLFSVAFHPSYSSNGRFFVNYTDRGGDTQIVEFRVSSDPLRAEPSPVRTILSIDQPFSNHNGGLVLFGPDGKLWIGMGDGGSGGDPAGNGQNLGVLLGKLLRIDVDQGVPYSVPADNPFVGRAGARGEVWAYGLRNPWRFSFDRETGDLYIADVGQNRFEEVNAVRGPGKGVNYGWNIMEGAECFEPRQGCDQEDLMLPVTAYDHGDGCSVTGGYVYRGGAIASLRGLYFYSDYCSGFVRSFRFDGERATGERRWPELEPGQQVTSFGEDAEAEIYLVTAEGSVYKVVPR